MENKSQTLFAQPIVTQQPIQQPSSSKQEAETQETYDNEFKYNRTDLVFGISFIGIGIIIFIVALWIEPLVKDIVNIQ
jgi:hypothetical protein